MDKLSNNSILFLGLANEYCNALESVETIDKEEFIDHMLKILPRIYISATDLDLPVIEERYADGVLD